MMKYLGLILILFACTKVPVGPVTTGPSQDIPEVKVEVREQCSNFTPTPVDILMLVDNSGSVPFLKADLANAVRKIAKAAGQFFNYRIYIAPLIAPPGETIEQRRQYQLIQNSPTGSQLSAQVITPDQISIANLRNVPRELGFRRARDMIKANSFIERPFLDNVFRKEAYQMTILISNGDDDDYDFIDMFGNKKDRNSFATRLSELQTLKASLSLKQMRFITVVNHNKCGTTVREPGLRYKAMSAHIYSGQQINDSNVSLTPDSYNLCGSNLDNVFDRLAETVKNFKKGHTYKFWPLGQSSDFDPEKLVVRKKISGETLQKDNTFSGFTVLPNFTPGLDIIDRSVHPSTQAVPAENYSGFFVELHGAGRVTYPDCLIVRKEDFDKFFGFVVWGEGFSEPDLSTLKVFINGQEIAKSLWEYMGHQESVNVLVQGASNLSAATPGIFKTGFTIRLKQGAVHSDGDKVEVRYKAKTL